MKPLIEDFRKEYGWEIKEIDINEEPYVAEVFEVTATPSIRMLDIERNSFNISNGYIIYPELKDRIYRYIRYQAGETDDRTFNNPLE
jgi:hypothetical protein